MDQGLRGFCTSWTLLCYVKAEAIVAGRIRKEAHAPHLHLPPSCTWMCCDCVLPCCIAALPPPAPLPVLQLWKASLLRLATKVAYVTCSQAARLLRHLRYQRVGGWVGGVGQGCVAARYTCP